MFAPRSFRKGKIKISCLKIKRRHLKIIFRYLKNKRRNLEIKFR
jgi:hypothetical protein